MRSPRRCGVRRCTPGPSDELKSRTIAAAVLIATLLTLLTLLSSTRRRSCWPGRGVFRISDICRFCIGGDAARTNTALSSACSKPRRGFPHCFPQICVPANID
jgi:hypothetical protein